MKSKLVLFGAGSVLAFASSLVWDTHPGVVVSSVVLSGVLCLLAVLSVLERIHTLILETMWEARDHHGGYLQIEKNRLKYERDMYRSLQDLGGRVHLPAHRSARRQPLPLDVAAIERNARGEHALYGCRCNANCTCKPN